MTALDGLVFELYVWRLIESFQLHDTNMHIACVDYGPAVVFYLSLIHI